MVVEVRITADNDQSAATVNELNKVKKAVTKAKRCVVIAGAGISVSSGIPDFRSPDGLFAQLKRQYPKSLVNGRDLFDAQLFRDPARTSLFYSFIGHLKSICTEANTTPTHAFLKRLHDEGRLLRVYTQNIDSLERRAGLPCGGDSIEGGSTRAYYDKATTRVVHLHGSLDRLVCTMHPSDHTFDFDESRTREFARISPPPSLASPSSSDSESEQSTFSPPPCPSCQELSNVREMSGVRAKSQGFLRPDIVLYNEPHPYSDLIGELQLHDLRRRPDLLIVMGTSLKIPGVRRLVKEMSKVVHSMAGGRTLVIDKCSSMSKEWEDVFDWHMVGESDRVIEVLSSSIVGNEPEKKRKRGDDEKENQTEKKKVTSKQLVDKGCITVDIRPTLSKTSKSKVKDTKAGTSSAQAKITFRKTKVISPAESTSKPIIKPIITKSTGLKNKISPVKLAVKMAASKKEKNISPNKLGFLVKKKSTTTSSYNNNKTKALPNLISKPRPLDSESKPAECVGFENSDGEQADDEASSAAEEHVSYLPPKAKILQAHENLTSPGFMANPICKTSMFDSCEKLDAAVHSITLSQRSTLSQISACLSDDGDLTALEDETILSDMESEGIKDIEVGEIRKEEKMEFDIAQRNEFAGDWSHGRLRKRGVAA